MSVLTPMEKQGATWAKIEAELNRRLTTLRSNNDAMTLTEAETQHLRGRIAELKSIIALGKADSVTAEYEVR